RGRTPPRQWGRTSKRQRLLSSGHIGHRPPWFAALVLFVLTSGYPVPQCIPGGGIPGAITGGSPQSDPVSRARLSAESAPTRGTPGSLVHPHRQPPLHVPQRRVVGYGIEPSLVQHLPLLRLQQPSTVPVGRL